MKNIFYLCVMWVFGRGASPTDMNPIHTTYPYNCFLKTFYVRYANDLVFNHLFMGNVSCLHAIFNPVDKNTFYFMFTGNLRGKTNTFTGILRSRTGRGIGCYKMTSPRYSDLSLCIEDANPLYNYMHITDIHGKTGFGIVDSISSLEHQDAIYEIMTSKHTDVHLIHHTGCTPIDTSLSISVNSTP